MFSLIRKPSLYDCPISAPSLHPIRPYPIPLPPCLLKLITFSKLKNLIYLVTNTILLVLLWRNFILLFSQKKIMKIFIHSTQKKVEQANKILKLKLKTLSESIGLSGLKVLLFALMSSGVHRLPPYKTIRGHYIHVIQ